MKDYNIGLDIGTSSVGWAILECNSQKVIKKNGKSLWGVRTFDSANTAIERRIKRSSRRRFDRRRKRIKLLQEEFSVEINKVDPDFFKKLEEFKYSKKDKNNKTIILSTEDKKIINGYPTIYHLRENLTNEKEKEDIRLIYLTMHHIIKYRGNFLEKNNFNTKNIDLIEEVTMVFDSFVNLCPNLEIKDDYKDLIDLNKIVEILLLKNKNDLKIALNKEIENIASKDFKNNFIKMILGYTFNVNKLLGLDDIENINLTFSNDDFEDKYNEYEIKLNDKIEVLVILKELYDIIYLKKLFNNENTSISKLMIDRYEIHKSDLRLLKDLFNKNRKLYNELFRSNEKYCCIYDEYIHNKISYEEFKNKLNKLLEKLFQSKLYDTNYVEKYNNSKTRIENDEFLPKITSTENGKYPYQLNKDELIKIIENQGKYYPFLLNKTEDGTYKIVKLLEFKIPYYIGPLVSDKQSKNAWMEKLTDIAITPYNFDQVVNKELSASKFIKRMISHCTYLLKEEALPNNSILYSKFKVLNELKQIKVNGERLTHSQRNNIIENLFKNTNSSITNKKFIDFLYTLDDFSMYNTINVTGYSADNKFANTLKSYNDFFGKNGIFENTSYTIDDAEKIIEWITIFEDKDILENTIRKNYPNLSSKIEQILNKNYKGWGRLSKKLLTEKYYIDKNNNKKSIIDIMEETDENFMQIINNDKYNFQKMIREYNKNYNNEIDLINDLKTSPATKKGIYQSLLVIKELIEYMGYEPKNIVIEMARNEEKKERKNDRKKYLTNIYNLQKKEIQNYNSLIKELNENDFDKKQINSEKLFLYFIQEGKCLYSAKPIDINNLEQCEIDHIIPRTLIKDDSIDNKALVYRKCNQDKAASYILPKEYRNERNIEWWKKLKKIGLISAKKYHNLTRYEYKQEEIEGFINRQLVETRQITKHVANIIKNLYKNTNVIYLKANLSSNYRKKYELFKFRKLNDYHHAHDAYLAAVLGEYKELYMNRKINFNIIKELNYRLKENKQYNELKYGYVINSLDKSVNSIINNIYNNLVNKSDYLLFDADKFNKTVEDHLYRNDILISRKTEIKSGRFYKETILPKGKGNIPIKENMPTDIYGGYSNVETSYMCLVEYKNKRKLIGIPKQIISKKNNNIKIKFIKEQLNLKTTENFIILKDKIPFELEIIYKNHPVYIKGYSINSKSNELCNAFQLKIKKELMKKWNKALEYYLNDNTNYELEANKYGDEIIEFLMNQDKFYPLFSKSINKIKNNINYKDINIIDKKTLINELLILYKCDSKNANLSTFKLDSRIGRLSGNNINKGILINKSITGLKESKYEF